MRALPCAIQVATAAETPFGGRTETWEEVGRAWLALQPSAPVDADAPDDAPPVRRETARAAGRLHPALASPLVHGARLLFADGRPWTVTAARPDDPAPGRVALLLERLL